MSRSLAWVPTGPARDTYDTKILADLEATLANTELPEGAPLFLKLYMIGRDIDSANPVVMVCCVHRGKRKEAESSIRESRILDRYPGFGLGSSALLLESHGLEELLTEVRASVGSGGSHTMLTSFQEHQIEKGTLQSNEELSSPVEIYASSPPRLGGAIRFVSYSREAQLVAHAATGGPIFEVHNNYYQITAAHGIRFGPVDEEVHYSSSELDECEFDGQSDFEGDSATSRGSSTPEQFSTQSSDEDSNLVEEASKLDQQNSVVQSPQIRTQPHGVSRPSLVQAKSFFKEYPVQLYLEFHNPDLDYVVLKLPTQSRLAGSVRPPRRGSRDVKRASRVGPNNTRVLVVTPDGSIPGRILPETTSYKMCGLTKLQRLLTVELCGVFLKGYSGSAVVDFVTGDVYGQITLGTPGKSLAYCVHAPDIFADISSRLGYTPILDENRWPINQHYGLRPTSLPSTYDTSRSVSYGRFRSRSFSYRSFRDSVRDTEPMRSESYSDEPLSYSGYGRPNEPPSNEPLSNESLSNEYPRYGPPSDDPLSNRYQSVN